MQVRTLDFLPAVDKAARGKIGPGYYLRELLDRDVSIAQQRHGRIDYLREIVGRYFGGHAHGYAIRTIDQEVWHTRRHHRGFVQRLVVVGLEIDRFLFNVGKNLIGEPRHAHFGVAHCRRRISVNRPEVALTIDQGITHREILCEPDNSVINRSVAVRMILTDDIADDARTLFVSLVIRVAEFVHGPENSTVDRF